MSETFRVSEQTIETAVETAARAIDTITGRAHPEITRFMDAPNRVEQCLGCDAVIVTPPPCATGEQLARARRLALMLRAELKEAS